MARTGHAIGVLVAATIAAMSAPAAAEVLDAVYRGTLVCDKLPFTRMQMREAIDVTISGGVARYNHVVRLRDRASEVLEKGAGVVKGQNIDLQESWKDDTRQYEANTAPRSCGAAPSSRAPKAGLTAAKRSPAPARARSSGR
jgi:hypothetical protein